MKLFVSAETDPRVNMGLEHFFLEEWGGEGCLVYRNSPSVLIGKNQNPYREVNIPFCKREGISIFRRISGGGAVYHDLGNINTAFFGNRGSTCCNLYRRWSEPLLKFLQGLGLDARLGGGNAVVIAGLKVSGFAQSLKRQRFLCHATLLYRGDLAALKRSLEAQDFVVKAQGIASRRSPVANVSQFLSRPEPSELFQHDLVEFLIRYLQCDRISTLPEGAALSTERFVESNVDLWEWNVGRSPPFTIALDGVNGSGTLRLAVCRGRIESATWENGITAQGESMSHLVGRPFRATSLPSVPGLDHSVWEKLLI